MEDFNAILYARTIKEKTETFLNVTGFVPQIILILGSI